MRVSFAVTVAALALVSAGCGGRMDAPDDSRNEGPASTRQDSSAERSDAVPSGTAPQGETTTPNVNPDAAPNLAFDYSYRFGLAADRIAGVQQRHASLCEELGQERCQVKGMTFRRNGESDVRAEMTIGIERGLAHRFGEQALAGVREAEGQLIDNEVTGEDVGNNARSAERSIAGAQEELARIEARAAATSAPAQRRSLLAEAARLRERIAALRGTRGVAQERPAMTQISLSYASGGYAGAGPDFGGAAVTAWGQLKWLAYSLFVILLTLGPWVLGGAFLWWGAHRLQRRTQTPTS